MDINGNLTTNSFLSSLANTSAIKRVNTHDTSLVETNNIKASDTPARKINPVSDITEIIRDTNNSVSFLQLASEGYGALNEGISEIRELAIAAMNEELTDEERLSLDEQAQTIKASLNESTSEVRFNEVSLLDQSREAIPLQVSADADGNIELGLINLQSAFVSTGFNDVDLTTQEGAKASLDILDSLQKEVELSTSQINEGLTRAKSFFDDLSTNQTNALTELSPVKDVSIMQDVSSLIREQLKRDASVLLQVQANPTKRAVLGLLKSVD